MLRRRTEGCFTDDMNKPSVYRLIGSQDPGDKAVVDTKPWTTEWQPEVRFIDDVLEDVQMNVDLIQARLERELRLAQAGGLSQVIASGGLNLGGQGAIQSIKVAQEQADAVDSIYKAEKAALAAVSSGDYEKLEALVDDQKININAMDDFGNTLLILDAQQGSKRIIKFLLRRGANINMQNFAGNTVLHYAYAYNHDDLGHYLESKGANNTYLNAVGLTCYEGLKREDLEHV